jgi:hypothetical protein
MTAKDLKVREERKKRAKVQMGKTRVLNRLQALTWFEAYLV